MRIACLRGGRPPRWAAATVAVVGLLGFAAVPASAAAGTSGLDSGEVLMARQSLVSPDAEYQLVMQGDGNLVEYFGGRALWNTGTQGHPGAHLAMQTDG